MLRAAQNLWVVGHDIGLILLILVAAALIVRQAARHKFVIRTVLRALRAGGPIPKHVAFIMDGNRRWARKSNLKVHEGHARGGDKLTESLEWCLDVGVRIVTVYAFSIENFKRSKEEVDEIMRLCEAKFRDMLDNSDVIRRNRVRVRVLGDLSRLSPSLRNLMHSVMNDSKGHRDGPLLNICFSYACRYDIACSVAKLVALCDSGQMKVEDITEHSLASCLATGYTSGADTATPYPELLVRTSGETRLSDFLLWEGCFSVLAFCDSLWPELSAWDFIELILEYQGRARARSCAISGRAGTPSLQGFDQ